VPEQKFPSESVDLRSLCWHPGSHNFFLQPSPNMCEIGKKWSHPSLSSYWGGNCIMVEPLPLSDTLLHKHIIILSWEEESIKYSSVHRSNLEPTHLDIVWLKLSDPPKVKG
jgi:hypothetical protein